jgi:hypothetical protein
METETLLLHLRSNYYTSSAQSRENIYGIGQVMIYSDNRLKDRWMMYWCRKVERMKPASQPAWSPQADLASLPQTLVRVLTTNIMKCIMSDFAQDYLIIRHFNKSLMCIYLYEIYSHITVGIFYGKEGWSEKWVKINKTWEFNLLIRGRSQANDG